MGGENETNPGQPGMGKWSKQGGQLGQEKRLEQGGQPEQLKQPEQTERKKQKKQRSTVKTVLWVIGAVCLGLFLQMVFGIGLIVYLANHPEKFYTEAGGKEIAARVLQEKYGEEFIVHNVWPKSPYEFFADCSPKENEDIVFRAAVWKDGSGIVYDRYPHGILAEKVEDIVREEINGIYEDFFLRVYVLAGPDFPAEDIGNMKDMTPVELAQKMWLPKYLIEIGIDADKEKNYQEEYEYFSQVIQGRVDRGEILKTYINIYAMDTEMREISEEYYSTHSSAMGEYSSRQDKCNQMRIECTEDGISLTYDEFKKMRDELGNYGKRK